MKHGHRKQLADLLHKTAAALRKRGMIEKKAESARCDARPWFSVDLRALQALRGERHAR